MSQAKPSSDPTEIAGRYQVVQRLGAGAFGTVYKAKDKILGRMVAIKTIRLEGLAAQGASLEELVDRFEREAQVSAQLRHPNIVTIYDIGEADGMSYLAMEFIDGVGLERVIASAGRLPLERAASIAAQVADALDFAHKNNVVHRDIKPANIMIEPGDRVKVTDFGIAKVTNSVDHLTATGSLLGTPSYMSPEQARGSALDGRSDLFAVGAVFYEMLAGTKAFRGESITGLIFKIIAEEPTPIREVDAELPDAVSQILARALSKAPETRYQTGRELADALLTLTRSGSNPTLRQAELATAPGGPSPAGPPTLATPLTVASTAEPTRVSQSGATAKRSPPPPVAATPRPASPPPPRAAARKGSIAPLIALGVVFLMLAAGVLAVGWYLFLRKPAVETAAVGDDPRPAMTPLPARETLPPATTPAAVEPSAAPVMTAPPETAPPASAAPAPPPTQAARVAPPPTRRAPDEPQGGRSFLDEEPVEQQADGSEAGRRLADGYRNSSGSGRTGTFGATGRFQARERTPRALLPAERPAVATMRHVIDAEEQYQAKNGRYGTLTEMAKAGTLFLDVSIQPGSFVRRGYRFELQPSGSSFRVSATPITPGSRPFTGDDSGIIRVGTE
jgi:eukaryotic-like serine/threonine-protein kinase